MIRCQRQQWLHVAASAVPAPKYNRDKRSAYPHCVQVNGAGGPARVTAILRVWMATGTMLYAIRILESRGPYVICQKFRIIFFHTTRKQSISARVYIIDQDGLKKG
jgi:hypothetical protein